jgi:hypothetical protein
MTRKITSTSSDGRVQFSVLRQYIVTTCGREVTRRQA